MSVELVLRLGVFASILLLTSIWETASPRRVRVASRWRRSINNLLLVVLDSLLVRLIPFLSAVTVARWASESHIGLLNLIEAPQWTKDITAFVMMDLIIYFQHVLAHRFPFFWRVHRVHHSDLDLDATSGLRFHPVEILFSMCVKIVSIIVLGMSAVATILFEVILNASSVFNHGNIRLPTWFDRLLRWLIVTPDMHRIHHSIRAEETHTNFGFNLPWWDWLFGTYRKASRAPQEQMILGLSELRSESQTVPVIKLLIMPFRRVKAESESQTPQDT